MKDFMWRLVHLEVSVWRGLVTTTIGFLASAGIFLAPGIPDTFVSLVVGVCGVIQFLWVRQGVTPNAKVVVEAPNPVDMPGLVVPGEAVTKAPPQQILAAAREAG